MDASHLSIPLPVVEEDGGGGGVGHRGVSVRSCSGALKKKTRTDFAQRPAAVIK